MPTFGVLGQGSLLEGLSLMFATDGQESVKLYEYEEGLVRVFALPVSVDSVLGNVEISWQQVLEFVGHVKSQYKPMATKAQSFAKEIRKQVGSVVFRYEIVGVVLYEVSYHHASKTVRTESRGGYQVSWSDFVLFVEAFTEFLKQCSNFEGYRG